MTPPDTGRIYVYLFYLYTPVEASRNRVQTFWLFRSIWKRPRNNVCKKEWPSYEPIEIDWQNSSNSKTVNWPSVGPKQLTTSTEWVLLIIEYQLTRCLSMWEALGIATRPSSAPVVQYGRIQTDHSARPWLRVYQVPDFGLCFYYYFQDPAWGRARVAGEGHIITVCNFKIT